MKKIFLISFLLITNLLITNHCLYAWWWPINRTPPIEGRVIDATTGKPIENVVVSALWWKGIPTPGGEMRGRKAFEIAITDKEGKYRIPAKITVHLLSYFESIMLEVTHPLYERKEETWRPKQIQNLKKGYKEFYFYSSQYGKEKEEKSKQEFEELFRKSGLTREEFLKRMGGTGFGMRLPGEYKNGAIYFDIQLLSLEEKYGMELSTKTAIEFDDYLRNNFGSDKNYFVLSKKLRILNENFLDYAFSKLLIIADKLPDCEGKIRAKERIKSYIKKYTP